MNLGEARRGNQGDDTTVKLEVSVQGAAAMHFGMAADVSCDLSVALTGCQQALPPLEGSPAAGICGLQQRESRMLCRTDLPLLAAWSHLLLQS